MLKKNSAQVLERGTLGERQRDQNEPEIFSQYLKYKDTYPSYNLTIQRCIQIADSADSDQQSVLGLHCLLSHFCPIILGDCGRMHSLAAVNSFSLLGIYSADSIWLKISSVGNLV